MFLTFSRYHGQANPRSSLSLVRKRLVNDLSYTEAQVLRAMKAKSLAELSFGGKRFQEELKLGSTNCWVCRVIGLQPTNLLIWEMDGNAHNKNTSWVTTQRFWKMFTPKLGEDETTNLTSIFFQISCFNHQPANLWSSLNNLRPVFVPPFSVFV